MTTPVNFELAKLLKEKGYRILPDFVSSYPTIAEVVMWLYEKHGVWVKVDVASKDFWHPSIINIEDGSFTVHPSFVSQNFIEKNGRMFNTPTEAYEAAIEYTLTKILK